jgi:hypothetical protein
MYGKVRALTHLGKHWAGDDPPVLIYNMGSVGSTSLRNSLQGTYPGFVVRTHHFGSNKDSPAVDVLRRFHTAGKVRLRFISMVRDPIAYNISRFFANAHRFNDVSESEWPDAGDDALDPVDILIPRFLQRFDHDYVLQWFDSWREAPGIDVQAHSFPDRGFTTIENETTDVLIIRTEISDAEKERAVCNFLGLQSFSLRRANVGAKNPYSESYERFKQEFVAPDWYIEKMYNNSFFRHFYTQTHWEHFVDRWT